MVIRSSWDLATAEVKKVTRKSVSPEGVVLDLGSRRGQAAINSFAALCRSRKVGSIRTLFMSGADFMFLEATIKESDDDELASLRLQRTRALKVDEDLATFAKGLLWWRDGVRVNTDNASAAGEKAREADSPVGGENRGSLGGAG